MNEDLTVTFTKKSQRWLGARFRNMGRHWRNMWRQPAARPIPEQALRWALSPEFLRAEGAKKWWLATPKGQRLLHAWAYHIYLLKKSIKCTGNGFHIDNRALAVL